MKKVLTRSFATLFIFLCLGTFANIIADEWTEKVVVDKKFEINKNAKLVVDHEFGNVQCKNWDKNSVSVKVTVRAKTTDAQKAEKIIKSVIVDVDGDKEKVTLECELNQKDSKNKNINVNIDVEIFMPKTVNLELENMFGTTYIESVSGQAKISCEYGSLEIGSLSNAENELEVMFSETKINSINNGKLEIGYSQLEIQTSNILSIESDYSELSIDKANSISFELEGGNLILGEVDKLDIESSFGSIEISTINNSLSSEMDYGALEVKNVGKDFSKIEIENSFGLINLNISNNITYNFEIEGEFLSFNYPDKNAKILHSNKDDFSTTVKGVIGKGSNPKSLISIESEYGAINLTAN